jgi:hypothetical protein
MTRRDASTPLFYDRIPLNARAFPLFPDRTLVTLDATGEVASSLPYSNVITGGLKNRRSETWNVEIDRQVIEKLLVRVAVVRNSNMSLISAIYNLVYLLCGASSMMGFSMSRSLWQRLASGVGAGDVWWIEE